MDSIREQDVDGVHVKVALEAEDTLAVRLKSVVAQGGPVRNPVRQVLERQARRIVEDLTYVGGELGVIEVDGISNAVQIRSRKPEGERFVEVILRNGDSIALEARGRPVHLSKENYEQLVETLVGLLK